MSQLINGYYLFNHIVNTEATQISDIFNFRSNNTEFENFEVFGDESMELSYVYYDSTLVAEGNGNTATFNENYQWLYFERADVSDDVFNFLNANAKPNNTGKWELSFNSNTGSYVPSQNVLKITNLPTPTLTGFIFDGWYYDNITFSNRVNINDYIDDNTTIYAKWTSATGKKIQIYNENGINLLAESDDEVSGIVYLLSQYYPTSHNVYVYDGGDINISYTTQLRDDITLLGFSTEIGGNIVIPINNQNEIAINYPYKLYEKWSTSPTPPVNGKNPFSIFDNVYTTNSIGLSNLSLDMWNSQYIDNLTDVFVNPREGVTSVKMFPFDVKNLIGAISDEFVNVGNWTSSITKGYKILSNSTNVLNVGQKFITPKFNNFLDYEPYTKIQIYLPFIGFTDLPVNKVMNNSIIIQYIIDFYTGNATIIITCNNEIIFTQDTQIAINVPISGSNASDIELNNRITKSSATIPAIKNTLNFVNGNYLNSALNAVESQINYENALLRNSAQHYSGGLIQDSLNSFQMPLNPFIIINRPISINISEYEKLKGKPSEFTDYLSNVHGYTEMGSFHADNLTCLENEKNEIVSLLQSGVILP